MATSKENLDAVRPQIDAVRDEDVIGVGMPLFYYLNQAELTHIRLVAFQPQLEKGKMDFNKVAQLPVLIGACKELYSITATVTLPSLAAQKEWKSLKEEAELLVYDMKIGMEYAYHNYPELLAKIRSIVEGGSSNPEFIQDLNDYAVTGRENKELTDAVGYDAANFERAAELSQRLGTLYAQVTYDRSTTPGQTLLRDKAFTLLRNAIDALNRQARFITRDNKTDAEKHTITPPPRKPSRKNKTTSEPAVLQSA